jgi:hypothetical protein
MSVNEYITKFTQLSHYAPHEVDTDEKKQEYFLNGLNDELAYALEARDFENFQGMVKKSLVLENYRGVIEHKQLCPKLNLKIRGVDFVANLIVLESKGIDIILGMD